MESDKFSLPRLSSQRFLAHSCRDDDDRRRISCDCTPSSRNFSLSSCNFCDPGRRHFTCEDVQDSAASGESVSFGEIVAAVPFSWEEAPGRPKLRSLMNSSSSCRWPRDGKSGVELFDDGALATTVPTTTRLFESSCRWPYSAVVPLSARFQAEMLATSVGHSEDMIRGNLMARRTLACYKSTCTLDHSNARFQAQRRRYKSEEFVIGSMLPLPPRLRSMKNQIVPDAASGFQRDPLSDPRHGAHRRARSFSTAIAPFRKEASISEEKEEEEDFSARDAGSKDIRPFLKNRMQRWRGGMLDLQRHLSSDFPQIVCNKVVDNHSTENIRILDFSPQHSDDSKVQREKQNDGPKDLSASRGSFRFNVALIARRSKSSSRTVPGSHFSTRPSPAAISPHNFHVPDISAREEPKSPGRPRRHPHPKARCTSCFTIPLPLQCCHSLHGLTLGYESP